MQENAMQINNFVRDWKDCKGYEKGEAQKFWLAFIRDVFNVKYPEKFIDFETQVKIDGNTKFLDGYLFDSKVIIEQKSADVKLDEKVFAQAKRYNDALNYGRKARWIVTCNFREFKIYDMETLAAPITILFEELPVNYYAFDFLIKKTRRTIEFDKDLDFEAGVSIKKLYDKMYSDYKNRHNRAVFQSLNKLCVRLVFCFYAESAGIFPKRKMFSDYMKNYFDKNVSFRAALKEIFEVLNTPLDKRSEFISDELNQFPYIDGGLFEDENFDFPEFQTGAREVFFENLAKLKWQDIDPTIFGAVFESTLQTFNDETNIRREEGIHYTAPENIHKVIEPLFFNDFYEKFQAVNSRADLINLQNEIAALKILDPACGSGNFLTESYLMLREIENSILEVLANDGLKLPENPIKISIENFHGIEINEFAVAVAKTALWISEIQMRQKLLNNFATARQEYIESGKTLRQDVLDALQLDLPHFPLKKIPHIICQNALTFDWQKLIAPADLNFIVGNPPFIGRKFRTQEQTLDLAMFFDYKDIDYVACWFKKASDFIQGSKVRCAFVATNSITQGEQVAPLWKNLNVHIDFAYRTFKWFSESPNMAQVHVVIIGFSQVPNIPKFLYEITEVEREKIDHSDPKKVDEKDKTKKFKITETIERIPAHNINAYLFDASNVFIEHRTTPVCDAPEMKNGNVVADDGNLIIEADEYEDFIKREPLAIKYIKNLIGSEEFINGKKRYCLWLVDCQPHELSKMPLVMKRIKAVREFRLKSSYKNLADKPALFRDLNNPKEFLILPVISSEKRYYMPIGYSNSADNIVTNAVQIIPNAGIYEFGILTSLVHMAWMRAFCGRLKSDYRYSKQIVYNNFVWCTPTEKQRRKIESTAQKILDVRAGYPDSSLATLYNELTMPPDLRAAHRANDLAVIEAYGFSRNITEPEIVAALMEKYLQLTK